MPGASLGREVAETMHRHGWPVTVSVGAVSFLSAPSTLEDALRQADALMYRAKRDGKDRVHLDAGGPDPDR